MQNTSLFRQQVLDAKRAKYLGNIVLIHPTSLRTFAILAVVIVTVMAGFLGWGSYTKRITVRGQLVPAGGAAKVYPPQAGIIVRKLVTEGQAVRQGDVLYVLSSERHIRGDYRVQESVSRQVAVREDSLRADRERLARTRAGEQRAGMAKLAGLRAELDTLDRQIEQQASRVRLAEETARRYEVLLAQGYVSTEQLQQKQEDMLDQRIRLHAQQRERAAVVRAIGVHQQELADLGNRYETQFAQIERTIASTVQERAESESKRDLVVVAPKDGTATALLAEVGEMVDPGRPLVTLLPLDGELYAQLQAPSRAIGFVQPGDEVRLRFHAYPYQKYGHGKGMVLFVSKTALPASELAGGAGRLPTSPDEEAQYRVTVRVDRPVQRGTGTPLALQAGMLVDADIRQESRRLYEWLFDPLYSVTRKL